MKLIKMKFKLNNILITFLFVEMTTFKVAYVNGSVVLTIK